MVTMALLLQDWHDDLLSPGLRAEEGFRLLLHLEWRFYLRGEQLPSHSLAYSPTEEGFRLLPHLEWRFYLRGEQLHSRSPPPVRINNDIHTIC